MNIGHASKVSGVSAKMIRYYEEIGLLPEAGRLESGYRDYGTPDVHRLAFVRRARDLGFSMDQIRALLSLWSDQSRSNAEVRAVASAHVAELESQAAKLQGMIETLRHLIGSCKRGGRPHCPIIAELGGGIAEGPAPEARRAGRQPGGARPLYNARVGALVARAGLQHSPSIVAKNIRGARLKPRIGLVLGDGAGIGAELAAKLLALPETAEVASILVIGDRRLLARGAKEAGVSPRIDAVVERLDGAVNGVVVLDRGNANPHTIPMGEISVEGARPALDNYRTALDLAQAGHLDAITFVPFNKQAMRLVDPHYEDELVFAAEHIGFKGTVAEFNVIDQFWNARVTSHVPLREVAAMITQERIIQRLMMTRDALIESGVAKPRIGVAALNPHAGDGGAFGREDLDIIAPAVVAAREQGIDAEGPYPSDTVYVRADKGAFDAVLSMYHDQGQIAIKLLGFDTGVTLLGGLPVPITTPAHGTAYDIAGRGIANVEPTRRAFDIAVRMAMRRAVRARGVRETV